MSCESDWFLTLLQVSSAVLVVGLVAASLES